MGKLKKPPEFRGIGWWIATRPPFWRRFLHGLILPAYWILGGIEGVMEGHYEWREDIAYAKRCADMLNVGKKAAGRELDGKVWDEYPATETER